MNLDLASMHNTEVVWDQPAFDRPFCLVMHVSAADMKLFALHADQLDLLALEVLSVRTDSTTADKLRAAAAILDVIERLRSNKPPAT